MLENVWRLPRIVLVLIFLGTIAGIFAAYKRLHVESRNRRVEIGIEWNEISQLAQISNQPVGEVLKKFRTEGVSTLIINEDTFITLEQSGVVFTQRNTTPDGISSNSVFLESDNTFNRIRAALKDRGLKISENTGSFIVPSTFFPAPRPIIKYNIIPGFRVPLEYSNLRTFGIGLPPEALKAAKESNLRIAGRIGNFAGVSESAASNVLHSLKNQGASTVIFNGEEALGYRGLEKTTADLLRNSSVTIASQETSPLTPTGLVYGAVEFGKQKGDEKISAALHGDYVRVHSIQTGEMGTLDENEIIERFVRAVRERNIRFCYVRLLTQTGSDAVSENLKFFHKIKTEMAKGSLLTGGGIHFGSARIFEETGIPKLVFLIAGLSTGAALIWMMSLMIPIPSSKSGVLILLSSLLFGAAAYFGGEMGRKVAALTAGIVFPTCACLITLPRSKISASASLTKMQCIYKAIMTMLIAVGITVIGIFHVIGLLSTEPFMVVANQFLGIKLQHAAPILIVVFTVLAGGTTLPQETWESYRNRCGSKLKSVLDEPARYGTLFLGILGLALLALVVARSGNDPGTGVSGFEMKTRSIMDHIFPVRPRTKELLGGHPAFILAIAWWWRGKTKLAIPCFIIGCLGQVSLLNTFCHIHTPLIISAWHAALGLLLGSTLGVVMFLLLEKLMPEPSILKAQAD